MTPINYLYAFIGGLIFGGINSWYWYRNGYRGGKLFFMGTIAFFGVIMLILKLFNPK
ncbi:hypothetical protein [Brumimicrobium glaciale]|jgi:hypothetical protein|uniref:hypothetical protein n=1 Tax=Brumimicrobium glaciale TaxID=200475 RepID=UPI0013EA0A93|nr:hypothetical protein [Brumimicrobium glaciale]